MALLDNKQLKQTKMAIRVYHPLESHYFISLQTNSKEFSFSISSLRLIPLFYSIQLNLILSWIIILSKL